jgi:flagellar basal body-associated protein FliL
MQKITAIFTTSVVSLLIGTAPVLAQAKPAPKLEVITPGENQTIYGDKVPVLMSTENFTLTDYQKNPPLVYGQGHIHLWLDDEKPTAESATKTFQEDFTFSDVPYGEHTLKVQFVNNNHTPVTPIQEKIIKFKSEAITTPSPVDSSAFDKNTALVILIIVSLVIVAAWWYTKEEDEEIEEEMDTENKKPKAKKTAKKKPAKKAASRSRRK